METRAHRENDRPAGARPEAGQWLRARNTWALLGFIAIAGFFVVTEHRAHLFGALPYLLLLACPLLHFFLHGGHGGHEDHGGHSENANHGAGREPGSPEEADRLAGHGDDLEGHQQDRGSAPHSGATR